MNGHSGTTSSVLPRGFVERTAASALPKPLSLCASSTSACVIDEAAVAPAVRREADQPAAEAELVPTRCGLSIASASSGEPAEASSSAVPRKYSISCPGRPCQRASMWSAKRCRCAAAYFHASRSLRMVKILRVPREAAVLGLEHGDLVGACDRPASPWRSLGPRLDLSGDEVEPELRQHLPHRRENGHHSAWYSVKTPSATGADVTSDGIAGRERSCADGSPRRRHRRRLRRPSGGREAQGAPVEITLVDRRNFHLFQPLTYQVATGALSPGEISYPLRAIFKRRGTCAWFSRRLRASTSTPASCICGSGRSARAAERSPSTHLSSPEARILLLRP